MEVVEPEAGSISYSVLGAPTAPEWAAPSRWESVKQFCWPPVRAGRHVQHEGLDAVVPGHSNQIVVGLDQLHGAGARIAEALEPGGDNRNAGVGELGEQNDLDGPLQPTCDRGVVAVESHLTVSESALHEQRVARARGAPEHTPVAQPMGHGLALIGTQADEGVLTSHQHLVGVDGGSHGSLLSGAQASEYKGGLRTVAKMNSLTKFKGADPLIPSHLQQLDSEVISSWAAMAGPLTSGVFGDSMVVVPATPLTLLGPASRPLRRGTGTLP